MAELFECSDRRAEENPGGKIRLVVSIGNWTDLNGSVIVLLSARWRDGDECDEKR